MFLMCTPCALLWVGLVAEPAMAGAGCLFGPAGLGGKILIYSYLGNLHGIIPLVLIHAYNLSP